ncbi:carbamoyltransferase HypF [Pseudonocardia spinosispora]|uniref:carbamoyltransferase HypF n=1 Tax=Pseudonocardia spinosispora TaxID=103441 RepID=UPI00048DF30A|nr:carbamoyltransferase HypF [Pseudonocardia spinosispora]
MSVRVRVRVSGIVQGVGFRPFVHTLAGSLGLSGHVGNDGSGVLLEAQGDRGAVRSLLAELTAHPPALAVVEDVSATEIPVCPDATGFVISASDIAGPRHTLISPDTATCDDCLAELADPADRRYRYPFLNCTNCGPRFTIVTGVPYDRAATTMADFPMCAACAAEYHDVTDRRFHAQPVCCPDCGPTLSLDGDRSDPIAGAARALRRGEIVAVKGLGGFHLATLAGASARYADVGAAAVARLRARKHREDKPFAVLVKDLDAARELVGVDEVSAELLTSRRRPIVLLPRLPGTRLAPEIAPGNQHLGILLPYTPLHHLLLDEVAEPIVLTSGNVSDEPIAFQDYEAARRLAPIADVFLTHDRRIHVRADDSVLRVVEGAPMPIRRSRGYAPEPLPMVVAARRPVLGCGAELKSTFCLARGEHAFLSHHIGDLGNYETLRSYTSGIAHFGELFDVDPVVLAHDLHPEYLSTKFAHDTADRRDVELLGVQHHHAHLASCLADNGVAGPVIGVACDGLGYGLDGTLWGGEVMVVSLTEFRRLTHLETVALPGGAAAIREPWRMAASYLRSAGHREVPSAAASLATRQGARWDQVGALLDGGVNTPPTSSAGRLFDAVAALVGLRDRVNYEGQAAIELEQRVDPAEMDWYPARLEGALIRGVDLVSAVLDDLAAGVDVGRIAGRFHNGVVEVLAMACVKARAETGLGVVALSGGVFQNVLLTTRLAARLRTDGFEVLTHHRVPPNDAGISFGQVAVAAARDLRPARG